MNSEAPVDAGDPRRLISALADGEADAAECGRGCSAWADAESAARRSWYAYHLIGDVLRSEDLASSPERDQAFLQRLRLRLAEEPAVLAPQALAKPAVAGARTARRAAWAMPAALAAGVMALATGLLVTRGPAGDAGSSGPAAAAPGPATVVAESSAPAMPILESTDQSSRIVRDARLDRYLQAHRDYGAALPGSLPGGSGRSIATVSFDR